LGLAGIADPGMARGLVCLACVDVPRRRKEERFASGERGVVIWPGGTGIECRLHDISLGGARLYAPRWHRVDDHGELALGDGSLRVPFRLLRRTEQDVVICFDPNVDTRRCLIARLFGGDYTRELEKVMVHRVLAALARHLLN
jgi:hypothetical protein